VTRDMGSGRKAHDNNVEQFREEGERIFAWVLCFSVVHEISREQIDEVQSLRVTRLTSTFESSR
jgi:hypothetical protein